MERLYANFWSDYELLDAGGGKKLERWGKVITIRPEVNAYFSAVWKESEWKRMAHAEFVEDSHTKGNWEFLKPMDSNEWTIDYHSLKYKLNFTSFKHLGVFPEQEANWRFIKEHIQPGDRFLNLFGYTGAASLNAAVAGADVVHCDSVKQVITWTKENMELSGLKDIRWVLDDALSFAQREVKRGHTYDFIIMDPPAFGMGKGKQRWKIENMFPDLVQNAIDLLAKKGYVIINTYSPRLKEKDINLHLNSICPGLDRKLYKLCMRTKTGKLLEYGEVTIIIK